MKNKLLAFLMIATMSLSFGACGSEKAEPAPAAETPKQEAPAKEEKAEEVATPVAEVEDTVEETVEEAVEEEGFSLLDVSTDMIESGIYAVAEDGTENVIALFTGPDGGNYVCVMMIPQEGDGDVICGSYTADTVGTLTDDEGVEWAAIQFVDAYTGGDCTAVFADFDDGSVMISNVDFSYVLAGEYLSADDTINFMGAAANYIP